MVIDHVANLSKLESIAISTSWLDSQTEKDKLQRWLAQDMGFETASTRSLLIIFGVVAAGATIFIATAVFPATNLIRETITEEITILNSSGGRFVVETSDSTLSTKTIDNCDLPEGGNVTISYQQGLANARIVSP